MEFKDVLDIIGLLSLPAPSQILTHDFGNSAQDPVTLQSGAFIINMMGRWYDYTPTITSCGGSITTVGAHSARFRLIGKTLELEYDITITTNGTASHGIYATCPFDVKTNSVFSGVNKGQWKSVFGFVPPGDPRILIRLYDSSHPIVANGDQLVLGGVVETSSTSTSTDVAINSYSRGAHSFREVLHFLRSYQVSLKRRSKN